MKRYWVFGAITLAARFGFAQMTDDLRELLEQAVLANGTNYVTARNHLVATQSNSVAQLKTISADDRQDWRVRLIAGSVAERIERGGEIEAFVKCNWRNDVDYKPDWELNREGPVIHLSPLVTKRCKEKGLWWYYMEMVWKETREYAKTPRMPDDDWRSAYTAACRGSPVYGLILRVTEERVRRDIDFRKWESRGALAFLQNSKTNTVLPFLLEILPHIPVADERNRPERAIKWINTLADPEDIPMIKEFYRKRGEQVPEALAPKMKELKERAAVAPSSK